MRVSSGTNKTLGPILLIGVLHSSAALAEQAEAPAATAPAEPEAELATPKETLPPGVTIQRQLAELVGRSGGLTADQAAARAVDTSTEVRTQQSEIAVAEADVDKVLYTSLPRLDLLARYTRLSPVGAQGFGPGTGSFVATTEPPGPLPPGAPLVGVPADAFAFPEVLNQYLLQASISIPLSDYLLSTASAAAAAKSNQRAAVVNRDAAKLDVAARTRILYYDWARSVLQVVVAEKSVEQAKESARTAQTAFDAGRASKADVLNAESLAGSAELRAERARTQAALSEQRLRLAMHDPSSKEYQIGEDLFAKGPGASTQTFDSLVAEARRKRLELLALDHSSESLSERTDVSDARGLPKLEAFGNAYYARPNQRFIAVQDEWKATWDVGVQLKWSPNDLGNSGADSRSLDAQRAKIQAQRTAVQDRIEQDVLNAYTALREAELSVVTSQQNLEAAEEAYRVQRLFYENGRGTTLELLDTESRLLQARIDLVNVRVAQRMAEVSLDHAVGRDVPAQAAR